MRPIVDPEGNELSHLAAVTELNEKNDLEIGCGHGNLSFPFGQLAGWVMGIDPLNSELALVQANRAPNAAKLLFVQA